MIAHANIIDIAVFNVKGSLNKRLLITLKTIIPTPKPINLLGQI
jgi:hypothetical protein